MVPDREVSPAEKNPAGGLRPDDRSVSSGFHDVGFQGFVVVVVLLLGEGGFIRTRPGATRHQAGCDPGGFVRNRPRATKSRGATAPRRGHPPPDPGSPDPKDSRIPMMEVLVQSLSQPGGRRSGGGVRGDAPIPEDGAPIRVRRAKGESPESGPWGSLNTSEL